MSPVLDRPDPANGPIRKGIVEPRTANEELKGSYSRWFAAGLIVAVLAHVALFELFPDMRAADVSTGAEPTETLNLPPQIEVPPPPEQIARPATPEVSAGVVAEDVTIGKTEFRDNPVEQLPPPKSAEPEDEAPPNFIPYDIGPRLQNRDEVLRHLQRTYPPSLKASGIGGTVTLWVYVDGQGRVQRTRLRESSGYDALDRAARKVVRRMEFSPAMNRDRKTAVWVAQRITFQVK